MLPSAKDYLIDGDLSPTASAYAIIGCFIGGVLSIQLLSRVMHHFIPLHVVGCNHTHEGHIEHDNSEEETHEPQSRSQNGDTTKMNDYFSEDTPLLSRDIPDSDIDHSHARSLLRELGRKASHNSDIASSTQRPNFQSRLTGLVRGGKISCVHDGPCLGYSDPCAQECFKPFGRTPMRQLNRGHSMGFQRGPGILRTSTAPRTTSKSRLLDDLDASNPHSYSHLARQSEESTESNLLRQATNGKAAQITSTHPSYDPESHPGHRHGGNPPNDPSQSHHHHVPTNAFLSIGLQTSIAIALHKLPEGFITYATNHANPKLGFSVFMALFIHNITEGFAMALPLYLAINSRWQAIFWSSLLGGVSQPLGAGIAALWFKAAGSGAHAPGAIVYGCMFAITSGVMASVALQLFSESLTLTHNRNLCIGFAFLGMTILGISFALTAG